jgi:hypothetical protein
MSDITQTIIELKTQAKNRRDLKRWDRAAALIMEAIGLAETEYNSTEAREWRVKMAIELADCWGILGGLERRRALEPASGGAQRQEHLRRSIDAYDKGYEYEKEALGSGNSTYNQLNRLLVRLLACDGTVDLRAEFEKLRPKLATVAEQISSRPIDNVWSAADMALLNILLGRQDAATAYAPFERMQPPDFARQSALEMLIPLAKLDLPNAKALRDAERRLGPR